MSSSQSFHCMVKRISLLVIHKRVVCVYVFSRNVCISLSLIMNHIVDVCFRQNSEFKVSNTYLK